jgi:phage host-nuclease inhibitor protein Gam
VTKTIPSSVRQGRNGPRVKRAAETAPVPRDMAEAAEAVARIGAIERELTLAGAVLAEVIALAKQDAEAQAAPLKAEMELLARGLQIWAEAHREALTGGGRSKTVKLATGEIAWRERPPSVRLRDVDAVLETLRAMQLGRFIRERHEVDREAMLREPGLAATVPGVTIGSAGEEFVVRPTQADLDGRVA